MAIINECNICGKYDREVLKDGLCDICAKRHDVKRSTVKADKRAEKEESVADVLAVAHWSYIENLLKTHSLTDGELKVIGFHYKTAFVHGFKHGIESLK